MDRETWLVDHFLPFAKKYATEYHQFMGDQLTSAYRRSGGVRPGHHFWYGSGVKRGEQEHYYEKAGVGVRPSRGHANSASIVQWTSLLCRMTKGKLKRVTDMERIQQARMELFTGKIKLREFGMRCYLIGKGAQHGA